MTSEWISSLLKSPILIQLPEAEKKNQHFGSNKQPFAFKNASRFFFLLLFLLKKFFFYVYVPLGGRVIFSFLLLGRR